MPPINVLVMIHGMTPDAQPKSPFDTTENGKYWGYNDFWNALCHKQPTLHDRFPQGFIGVEWGHEQPDEIALPTNSLRPDHQLTRAQNFVNEKVAYDHLIKDPSPNNHTLSLFGDLALLSPIVRSLVINLRESIVTRGLGDVIYYCSSDGEGHVRKTVYSQVLQHLDPYLGQSEIRLHLIGQSLGVTLTHDFLYGLFKPDDNYTPGFYQQGDDADVARFKVWRQKAQAGQLKLGSLTSTASQLPLFMMRKQELVNRLANSQLINATDIGVIDSNRIQWQLFYDVDDLLGFGTRRLYTCSNAICEYQVDTDDNPADAHTAYWKNKTVIEKTAELLLTNSTTH